MPFQRIDVLTFKTRLDEGWTPYVLDVRGQAEHDLVKLDFTDQLEPHVSVARIAEGLPRDRDILIYCRSGGRSGMAAAVLESMGFDGEKLYNLEGGINAWATQVDRTLSPY